MTKYLLFAFTCLFALTAQGQRLERFSEDPAEFLQQLEGYMTASKRKVLEDTYKDFATVYGNGLFTEEEVNQILKTGNAMLEQRMVASPYFQNYLRAVSAVKTGADPERHFKEWHSVLDQVLANIENRHLKPFDEFVKFSMQFFEQQALRYSPSGGTSWYAITDDYSFEYVDGAPVISFEQLDLLANRRTDSISIEQTKGRFLPNDKIWKGQGGRVTWARHGLGPEVYAELGEYEFEMITSLYEVKDAKMHYPIYFGQKAVAGTFSDKLVARNDATGGSFPRFESNEPLEVDNIGDGIVYEGGFRLQGTTVYGFGSEEQEAKIDISDAENQASFFGASDLFTIKRGNSIYGKSVEGILEIGGDTIYHPSVDVRFNIPDRVMVLSRGDRASDRNPFYSSMHQIHIFAEDITVYLNGDSIAIGREKRPLKDKPAVAFESFNFFKERDYQTLQNIATVNPIAVLKILHDDQNTRVFPADVVAKKLNPRFGVENIKSLLFDMVSRGFINYDNEKEIVEIKDKTLLYANAHLKKSDYDVLRIESNYDKANAIIDVKEKTIDMEGVAKVELSEKQRVAILPKGQQLTMRENRDMDIDSSIIYAGYTTLDGKGFHFKYDPFLIELDSVGQFRLFPPTGNMMKNGQPEAVSIGSLIENITGVLLIDAPSNKSGQEEIPMFPSLQSKEESYVYYDVNNKQDTAYVRDSFYFQLYPFSFNHLDYFTRDDITFDGIMYSADIFPLFNETITLQEDESLGFITDTKGEKGYTAYREKGMYKGEISLSNQGFLGKGDVTYLGAKINSEDIIFMPKQMLASADRFDLEENRTEGEEVPQVRGLDVRIDWKPYRDSMYIDSEQEAFALFQDGNHTLAGTLILTPGGLKGDGVLDWEIAAMTSDLFSFGAFSSYADTTKLRIKTQDLDDVAIETENVISDVDFDEKEATFRANDEFLETTMPATQFKTSMNEFTWDMAEDFITFQSKPDKLGQFVSIHPDKDSLFFRGAEALYDLKTDELKVSGVPFIVASDAFVYPDSQYVEVGRGGDLKTLENAQIIADTVNKYHVINRATVNIIGRREYKASGFYEYNIGEREQEIEFGDIVGQPLGKGSRSERPSITTGTSQITPEKELYIDHLTQFQGTITMSANDRNLDFDGFARLDAPKLPHKYWFTVRSKADKNNLAIRYDAPKTFEGDPTETGFFLSKETAEVYPRIMAPTFTRKDRAILPASKGLFTYNKQKDVFRFGDSTRVLTGAIEGNLLTFYNGTGKVEGSGRFNIGSGLKYVNVEAAGRLRSQFLEKPEEIMDNLIMSDTASLVTQAEDVAPRENYQVEGDFTAGINLILPDKLLKIMENDIVKNSFEATNIIYLTELEYYREALTNLLPEGKERQNALSSLGIGLLDIPKKVNPYTFLFSKIPMKWNTDYQSFVSQGSKQGLVSINGTAINKQLEAYVEFKMPSNEDDRLYIHLKSPSELFYYFGFKQGIMSITSNNTAFMDAINGMKSKELIMKMDDGNTYEIQPVDVGTARLFLNRAKAGQK